MKTLVFIALSLFVPTLLYSLPVAACMLLLTKRSLWMYTEISFIPLITMLATWWFGWQLFGWKSNGGWEHVCWIFFTVGFSPNICLLFAKFGFLSLEKPFWLGIWLFASAAILTAIALNILR